MDKMSSQVAITTQEQKYIILVAGDYIAGVNQEHLDTEIYLKAMSPHPGTAHQCHLHFRIGTTGGKIT